MRGELVAMRNERSKRGVASAAHGGLRAPRWRLSAIVVLALAASFAAIGDADAQGRAASVFVDYVDTRDVVETTPVIGRLKASVESRIAARVSGVVETVLVDAGDPVAEGDLIAQLDTERLEIERTVRRSAIVEAESAESVALARLRLAEQALARSERLRGSSAFSQSNVEDNVQRVAEAMADRARAAAAVETAKAQLAATEYDIARGAIVAPFNGVVLERAAQPGQFIQLGAPAATLLDVSKLEVEADVPNDLIGGLAPGTEVEAAFETGLGGATNAQETLRATVRAIVPSATIATQTRPVRFTLDLDTMAPTRLAAGEAMTIFAPSGASRSVSTVPKDALVYGSGGWIVFVVDDGKAAPRPVTLGAPTEGRVEVRAGLAPGDVVVVRGNERLRPGQPVEPIFVDEEPAGEGDEAAAATEG